MVRCVRGMMGIVSCRRQALFLCGVLFVFCCSATAFAQYHFDSWTTANGLPNNWLQALRQTHDGYLWLTTSNGIVRFDGVNFRIFNKTNTPSLTSNSFSYRAMWEDKQGNLWMGTTDSGLIRYHDGVFTSLTTEDGLPGDFVVRIDEDGSGTVWITTTSGVVRWKDGHLILPRSESDRSLDAYVSTPKNLGVDGHWFPLWRSTGSEWQRFAYGHWSPLLLPSDLRDPAAVHIDGITEDSDHRLWYSLQNHPHTYYCISDGHLTVIHNVPWVSATQICCRDREGRVWMGNHYGAVGLWADGRFQPLPGISTDNVFQLLEDREGTVWIATLDRGLYRLRKKVITIYRRPGGVQLANVMGPLLQDRNGAIWVHSGGLSRFEGGRFRNFYRQPDIRRAWAWANWVTALYEDQDGSLWVGTFDGIARFEEGRLHEDKFLSAEIKDIIYSILRDRAGDLWLGGGKGLYRLHQNDVSSFARDDGLPSNSVNVIYGDRTGSLWIGTASGLVSYSDGRFVRVKPTLGMNITALYEDKAGILWVGTHDSGLGRLKRGPNGIELTRYTTLQGLDSDRVYQVLEDDLGSLWMSSDLGICRVRKRELNDFADGRVSYFASTHFGQADGLTGEGNNAGQPMAFKAHNGQLWFATQDGIAVIDPKDVPFNLNPPPVRIEDCLVDQQRVACGPSIRMKPAQTNLEISYTALTSIKAEQTRFSYKLDGLDHEWIQAGTRRTASFSHLPAGKYVFRVIAANADGVWNLSGDSLAVVVQPPFYRTWWFLGLSLLVVIGASVLAWRYRSAQLTRAHTMQQAFSRQLIASQEEERKRIAAELHDSLGQRLVVIKNLTLLSLNNGVSNGSTRARLEEASAEASHALNEMREISHNLRPYQLDQLGLTKAVEGIVRNVRTATSIHFQTDIDEIDELFPKDMEINFYRIVQESINNMMRHSNATEAAITVSHSANEILLTISDNGKGFLPATETADRQPASDCSISPNAPSFSAVTCRYSRRRGKERRCMSGFRSVRNGMDGEIHIVMADDHPVFRHGLRQVIEADGKFKIVGEAGDGEAALALISGLKPAIALLDMKMPKLDGLHVARAIRKDRLPVEVIFLTIHNEEEFFYTAMDLGAKGYLLKDSAVTDILKAVATVAAGNYYVTPSLTGYLLERRSRAQVLVRKQPGLEDLTPTERRILRLVAQGKSSKSIAGELFVHYRTIENHRAAICQKLGLHGHIALVKFAFEHKSEL